ncbi:hypothetical protein P8452_38479 [Trifolium repens]|nr:hypothetical protein QL285_070764 [Trifolium repens]WJX52361.1 hypothetical protein P8452_38479 [Trifolium repens]
MEGINFKWSDDPEYEKIFCELCIKFIRKNGRVSFKWKEINQEFEAAIKRNCQIKTLKNKFDTMKKDWRIWRFLKFGETGLGWDPVTGKLSCSDDWWDRKIKEKPEAKNFRNKSVDPSIEEYWNQLFDDNYACGDDVVAPSVDPNSVQPVEHVNVEEKDNESGGEDNHHNESDGEHVYAEYQKHASQVENLFQEENSFWPDFMNEVAGTQVPNQGLGGTQVPSQGLEGTQVTGQGGGTKRAAENINNKLYKGNRKRKQTGGAAKLGGQIETLISQSHKALEIMQSDGNACKQVNGSFTIATAMTVIKNMVTKGVLEKGSELWCFAACLIENESRREIFLNMEDDEARKLWLAYMHSKEK